MHLCGNTDKYNQIIEWIKNQLEHKAKLSVNNLLFISGNSGVGKSYSIHHICTELNLYITSITTNNCSTSAQLQDIITKTITSSMIQLLTANTQQKIIIIDEFESMMAIDRTMNTALLNILSNKNLKSIPIICIASNEMIKKMGVLKKKCQHITLDNPTTDEILCLMKILYPDKNNNTLSKICKNSNGNISQCLQKLENNIVDNVDDIINIKVLYTNFDRDNIRKLILTEPWLTPLCFHENLINELKNRKITAKKEKTYYKQFIKSFIFFDNFIFSHLDIAVDIFICSIYPLFKMPYKSLCQENGEIFTKLLSYLSLQKKLSKKSYSSSDFPLYQLSTYHTNIIGRNYIFFN